jgi:hypothetical protein
MKRIVTIIAVLSWFLAGFTGCSPEFDEPPAKEYKYEGKATHTIAQFKSQFNSDFAKITGNVILKGIVNATDESGNIYKKLYLQDETGGLEISLDATSLYTQFKVGQEIFIECKDLYVGKYGGVLQLGFPYKKDGADAIGRMPQVVAMAHIFKSGVVNPASVKPTIVSGMADIRKSDVKKIMTDKLVTINGIYFVNGGKQSFAEKGAKYPTAQQFIDSKGKKGMLYTSSYAKFALDMLPKGLGSITGILSSYNGAWQLIIRDRNDIGTFDPSVTEPPKPPIYTGTATHTIAQFKTLFANTSLAEITQNIVIKGIVSSSDQSGNIFKKLYIQDESGAIEINISAKELYKTYQLGQEIFVECQGLYVGKYGGVVQIGADYNGKIGQMTEEDADYQIFVKQAPGAQVAPTATDLASLNESMIDKLVTIKGLTFTNGGKNAYATAGNTYPTSEALTDANGNSIITYTSSYANFAATTLPTGSVTITAILSQFNGVWQLIIVDVKDVVKQ